MFDYDFAYKTEKTKKLTINLKKNIRHVCKIWKSHVFLLWHSNPDYIDQYLFDTTTSRISTFSGNTSLADRYKCASPHTPCNLIEHPLPIVFDPLAPTLGNTRVTALNSSFTGALPRCVARRETTIHNTILMFFLNWRSKRKQSNAQHAISEISGHVRHENNNVNFSFSPQEFRILFYFYFTLSFFLRPSFSPSGEFNIARVMVLPH